MSLPQTQTALVVKTLGPQFLVQLDPLYPVPNLQIGQALVELLYSGVCHSDLSGINGHWDEMQKCAVPGHEGVGILIALHPTVPARSAQAIGSLVGVPLVRNPCHSCRRCREPDGEVYCEVGLFNGFDVDGTYQKYIAIDANYMIPVPQACDPKVVGPVLCGGVTAYKAIKVSNTIAGDWIAISGAGGGLGTLAVQYAVSRGLRVIGIDTGHLKAEKIKSLGAEAFIDYVVESPVDMVTKLTNGEGVHAVIVLAPVEKSYNQALELLKHRGTLVAVGIPDPQSRLSFSPGLLIYKKITLVGTLVGTRNDIIEALDFVARGKVVPDIELFKPKQIMDVFRKMELGEIVGRAVLDFTS